MTLSGINQLWTADMTYIRLETEFIYLAVVLDAFSRKVIGWAVDRTLEASLPLAALKMALAKRQFKPGLVHHSDRGVQYASHEYAGLLIEHGIQISMSRKANPYDNAQTESFMKTLKYEEVFRQEYRDLAEAGRSLQRFIEKVYNQKACIRRSDIVRRQSLKRNSRRWLNHVCQEQHEFFQASGNLSIRCESGGPESGAISAPGLIVSMSFQPVIPWRVALQHCPPPLRQLALILR